MILFSLVCAVVATAFGEYADRRLEALVAFWFIDQPAQWSSVERCQTAILLFTDRDWWPLTQDLLRELQRFGYASCVAIWYWKQRNETGVLPEPLANTECPFMIDWRASRSDVWGTPAYFAKIGDRIPIALAVLKHLNRRVGGLAMFDSDIAIQRNVVKRMERVQSTLTIQTEVVCSNGRATCANGGFWRVRNDDAARRLLSDVNDAMLKLRVSDQEAFDIVLASTARRHRQLARGEPATVNVTYLDPLLYATGYVVQHNTSWDFTRSYMLHANWCVSLACKREYLRDARRGRFDLIRQRFSNKKTYY